MASSGGRRVLGALLLVVFLAPHLLQCRQPPFVDEEPIIGNVVHFQAQRTLVPSHFAYPTLYSYLIALPVLLNAIVLRQWGGGAGLDDLGGLYHIHPDWVQWPARLLSVLAVVLAALVIFRLARRQYGEWPAAVAGLGLLVSPGPLTYGSYALPDAVTMLFVALSLWQSAQLAEAGTPKARQRALLWAALCAGFATATKYTGAVAVVPLACALLVRWRAEGAEPRAWFGETARGVALVLGGFLIAEPALFVVPVAYLDGVLAERAHMKIGHLGAMGLPLVGQLELLVRWATGLVFLGGGGLMVWLRRREGRGGLLALVLVLATLALTMPAKKQSLQYLFPLLPALALLSAHWAEQLLRRPRAAAWVLLLLPLGLSFAHSLGLSGQCLKPTTYQEAADWIEANLAPGTAIALDRQYIPRLYSDVELAAFRGTLHNPEAPVFADFLTRTPRYTTVRLISLAIHYDRQKLMASPAQYLVTSGWCFDRFFQRETLSGRPPAPGSPLYEQFQSRSAFYHWLLGGTDWERVFRTTSRNGPSVIVLKRRR